MERADLVTGARLLVRGMTLGTTGEPPESDPGEGNADCDGDPRQVALSRRGNRCDDEAEHDERRW